MAAILDAVTTTTEEAINLAAVNAELQQLEAKGDDMLYGRFPDIHNAWVGVQTAYELFDTSFGTLTAAPANARNLIAALQGLISQFEAAATAAV